MEVKDLTTLLQAVCDLDDLSLLHIGLARRHYLQLWIEWVTTEDLSLHLADKLEIVAEFEGVHDISLKSTPFEEDQT